MSRRVALPQADDLFRPTAVPDPSDVPTQGKRAKPRVVEPVAEPVPEPVSGTQSAAEGKPQRAEVEEAREKHTHSGRVKHDEKMTIYITSDELLDLEYARLVLRRTLGNAVDRGKLVRAAVAMALADLETNGENSALVQRLQA